MSIQQKIYWVLWLVLTAAIATYFGLRLTGSDENKDMFLPGQTTHGHYQIEMACSSCHKDEFGGMDVLQDACLDCHKDELKAANDSHPKSKFTDPRNANRIEILDARYCITCHQEHNDDITNDMGLTLQDDYCYRCHEDVADERPSHEGLAFDSCAISGCHNYHDNTALYEDFLEKHLGEADTDVRGRVARRDLSSFIKTTSPKELIALSDNDVDIPAHIEDSAKSANRWLKYQSITGHWQMSSHSKSGVNCADCHMDTSSSTWVDKPAISVCSDCHSKEYEGFTNGKHGMRIKQGMSPMTPAMARLPMKENVHDKQLDCNSCHSTHEYDTRTAAVNSCTSCHDDNHTKAYKDSPHHALWQKELMGEITEGSGVSCATCHMPREAIKEKGVDRILVQHNQNNNLRPNEKMIRSVCMNCHGLEFSINALADSELIKNNFNGLPKTRVESMTWVKDRVIQREKKSTNSSQPLKE